MPPALDLTNRIFGRWEVLCFSHANKRRARFWLCRCVGCGRERAILGSSLIRGGSLGCQQCRGADRRTHGETRTLLYRRWQAMKTRCGNPAARDFRYYGARGVSVHPEWAESFAVFRDAIGAPPSPEHTLERINPWLGYQPGNVTWATTAEQRRNQRRSPRSVEEKRRLGAAWIAEMMIRLHHTGSPLPTIPQARRPRREGAS
jgi:hypothetical protein